VPWLYILPGLPFDFGTKHFTDMFLQVLTASQKPAAGRHPRASSPQAAVHAAQPTSAIASLHRPTSFMRIRHYVSSRPPTPIFPTSRLIVQCGTSQSTPDHQQHTNRRPPAHQQVTFIPVALPRPAVRRLRSISQRPFSSNPSPGQLAPTVPSPSAHQLQPATTS
jgi:hypothetical protein